MKKQTNFKTRLQRKKCCLKVKGRTGFRHLGSSFSSLGRNSLASVSISFQIYERLFFLPWFSHCIVSIKMISYRYFYGSSYYRHYFWNFLFADSDLFSKWKSPQVETYVIQRVTERNKIQVCALAGSPRILEYLKFELKRLISKNIFLVICLRSNNKLVFLSSLS